MYRLIYRSRATSPLDWPVIEAILHAADKNNRNHKITGFLLASRSHFMQVIEGRYEDVNRTFMRIVRDKRHTDVEIVGFDVISGRLFGGWSMRGIGVLDTNSDIARRLMEKYGSEEGGVRFPREPWLALAMIFDLNAIEVPAAWRR